LNASVEGTCFSRYRTIESSLKLYLMVENFSWLELITLEPIRK
jgi:hypothetical protein